MNRQIYKIIEGKTRMFSPVVVGADNINIWRINGLIVSRMADLKNLRIAVYIFLAQGNNSGSGRVRIYLLPSLSESPANHYTKLFHCELIMTTINLILGSDSVTVS